MRVSREFEGEVELNKQARTWAIRVAKESHNIKLNTRRLGQLCEKTNAVSGYVVLDFIMKFLKSSTDGAVG